MMRERRRNVRVRPSADYDIVVEYLDGLLTVRLAVLDVAIGGMGLVVDDLFATTGAAFRALALPGFMDNLRRDARSIIDDGRFFSPLHADIAVPWVCTDDIAAVAADLLSDRGWTGHGSRPVLGPEDLSMNHAAAVLTDVLGRTVEYVEVAMDDFHAALLARGASRAMADGMVAMMVAKNAGLDNHQARTAEYSSPTTLREWAERNLRPVRQG